MYIIHVHKLIPKYERVHLVSHFPSVLYRFNFNIGELFLKSALKITDVTHNTLFRFFFWARARPRHRNDS